MFLKSISSPINDLEIVFPKKGKLARKPINRGQLQVRKRIRSLKAPAHHIQCESSSEHTYVELLECASWISETFNINDHPDFLIRSKKIGLDYR